MATPDSIATAADYADALICARRAKNWLFLLILLILLVQLAIFFLWRYDVFSRPAPPAVQKAATRVAQVATTAPAVASSTTQDLAESFCQYLTGLADFAGIVLAIVLALVTLLIVQIMLVGRLIGVGRVTGAFIWTLVLCVLLFPWQAFLGAYAFKIPGVLYTWQELITNARFHNLTLPETILHWARFVGFPIVALILLLAIQVKSTRGLRQALGEAEPERPIA